MIAFSFEPRADDGSWSPDWRPQEPELTASDFCLRYFKADLRLVVHGVDLSVRLRGEPVVDIALLLDHAARELETCGGIAVEASLTQHVYSFRREATTVTLTTEWPPATAELTWAELRGLAERAKAEAVRLITAAHPELGANAWLRETVGAPPA
ncbi:hypothetical protein [Streptomyces camelliae]|uniref:Uncharacterized protein n=1 Tax=Streptomyces camelliae TaxID=3004093 RepID=A0ABY7P2K3_9ACTN|nr:hypothetical protein [Streptomyces sp. HUAS 2-6]WBO63790.1 hypothetical protein O1G22_13610 [Streptomyces sp. HUAS 2-6]